MSYRRIVFIVAFISILLVFTASGRAQSWNVWGATPVFDGGRVMPLNTFSRQIVKEICGTPRPFIVLDDSIIAQLNRVLESQPVQTQELQEEQAPFLIRGTDIFGDTGLVYHEESAGSQHQTDSVAPMVQGLNRTRVELIIQRIKTLIPQTGRYFDSNELVLSWIGEPEIWDFIPIFQAHESDFRTEVLGVPLQNSIRTNLPRVSVSQLQYSERFQRRLADIDRKNQQRGVTPVFGPYDHIAERMARAMMAYQEFTFHPRRQRPSRMLEILENAVDLSGGRDASYTSAFEAWSYLLSMGAAPEMQSIVPQDAEDGLTRRHPTTVRWHSILQRIKLLHRAFDRTDVHGKPMPPNLKAVERQFEAILGLFDKNLEESEALMERIYPSVAFRKPGNERTNVETLLPLLFRPEALERNKESVSKIVPNYHYAVKKMRREIEAAYLSLYDNGRSLRVVPLGSNLALGNVEDAALGVSPWGSMQMLLYGDDDFIRRFFDPRFEQGAALDLPAEATEEETLLQMSPELEMSRQLTLDAEEAKEEESDGKDSDSAKTEEESEEKQWERELFAGEEYTAWSSRSRSSASQPNLGPIGKLRSHFQNLVGSYSTLVREYANTRFNSAANDVQADLRETAARSETLRSERIDDEHPATEEFLAKTAYPTAGVVRAEYRYYRLAPFFWMWIFAAAALVVTLVSLFLERRQRLVSNDAERKALLESENYDFTKTPEEYTLGLGIFFLTASIFVTFLGGVMRAWISGWAPVTNMYETVVLMAFSASLFGLWYALYPLVHPALQMAWRYSSFPTVKQWVEWLKTKPSEPVMEENDGEQAMRQAAADFGLPGGMPLGMSPMSTPEQTEADRVEQKAKKTLFWQSIFFIPRVILMLVTFLLVVHLSYGEYAHEHGAFAAALQMFKMSDTIDWLVVVASIALIVWFVPHMVLTLLLFPIILVRPSAIADDLGIVTFAQRETPQVGSGGRSEMSSVFSGETGSLSEMVDVSGKHWLSYARNQILDRKLFVIIAAAVALMAGLAAHFNSTEFNPDIRPIVAVLRSNFWLTVHVIAIIVSYAAAMIAWGMAAVALGDVIFGRYRYTERADGRSDVRLPAMSEMFSPIIHKLLQTAVLLLIIGTVLGARWADYSWGRFWSWDPKEVWALITILFFVVVLHGRIARFYDRVGVMVGALFGSIAVIVTWYGINFVFKGSIHSYGGGAASSATTFMAGFIIMNLLWGCLAIFRYSAVMFGQDAEEQQ